MGRKLLCLNEFALFIPHPYSAISCCRIYLLPRRLKVWQCPLWAVSRVNLCFDSPWSSSFFFFFPALSCGIWDLSSPAGDWTHAPDLGAQSLNLWTTKEIPGSSSWRPVRFVRPRLKLGRWVTGLLLRANFYLFHWPRLVEPCSPEHDASSSFRRSLTLALNPLAHLNQIKLLDIDKSLQNCGQKPGKKMFKECKIQWEWKIWQPRWGSTKFSELL